MSFGRPPSFSSFTVSSPDRGPFPLDHDDECKHHMMAYLNCLKKNGNSSLSCKESSKSYLECRMASGLMERDDWKNLGMEKKSDEPNG